MLMISNLIFDIPYISVDSFDSEMGFIIRSGMANQGLEWNRCIYATLWFINIP